MSAEDRLPVIQKPKARTGSSKKLLLFLFIFFVTLLLVLFFQSSLNEVTEVEIEGQELVSAEEIGQASGVKLGDHFFSVPSGQIEQSVEKLPMIETAEVSKHFPGKIRIQVKEYPKVAYQIGENGRLEALLADGSAIPVTAQAGVALDMPLLTGWADNDPLKLELCRAMAGIPAAQFSDVSEILPFPSSSYPDKIKMYTRSQYEVHTLISYLPEKMKALNSYIATLKEDNKIGGILTLLEADSHGPYDPQAGRKTQGETNGLQEDTKGGQEDAKNEREDSKGQQDDSKGQQDDTKGQQDAQKDGQEDPKNGLEENSSREKEVPGN